MNYTSQLKGWAVDRVIQNKKSGYEDVGLLIRDAQALVDFCYCPEEEVAYLEGRLAELDHEAKRKAAEAMIPATGFTDKPESVQ